MLSTVRTMRRPAARVRRVHRGLLTGPPHAESRGDHDRDCDRERTSSFSRVPTAPPPVPVPTAAAGPSLGSVRRAWRPMLERLGAFPALQRAAVAAASFFTSPSEIDFQLPRTFDRKYRVAELLGEGAFGRVHRVVPVDTRVDLDLAVKIIPKQRVVTLKDYEALQQEGRMMVLLGGTLNVVHFFGAYEDDESVYLVMEHCVGGDALARLEQSEPSAAGDEALVAVYMADILHVVWQCHLLRILHGDLKLENFLFADEHEASPLKLTDFGGASFLGDGERLFEIRGTPLYTAPEVLQADAGYSFPSDMWSCGVILYRLLSGRFPFEGSLLDERILIEAIDVESAPWGAVSADAKHLVLGLLERDPARRLTAEQALQHPWLRRMTAAGSAPAGAPTPLLNGTMVQRLQLYRSLNSFQQAVFTEIARRLPVDAKRELVVVFSEMSRHGAAEVGLREFAACLARGGYRLTHGEVKSLLSRLDLDGDGLLTRDEFCAALLDWSVLQRECPARWHAVVDAVFDELDRDRDGRLALDDLARLAPFSESPRVPSLSFRSDLRRCFRHADLDGDGAIDRSEFHSMLHIQLRAYEHFATRTAASHSDRD
ncbi:hypothetical protein ATCC90586_008081 [Pythium insidiosum]|nr:hypothetical protein ATCC90586_008081 [Pythium insidiosum]